MAHEFGHHVAFGYGTQAELGAAPAGWPVSGNPPVERWADCVSQGFTGVSARLARPGALRRRVAVVDDGLAGGRARGTPAHRLRLFGVSCGRGDPSTPAIGPG